ncbi:MAG TPA: hypothetical protein VGF67_06280, partial [Ktedonobacteraceae bacterium]
DYQVDHLLLLVGANPLPNIVAGRLLVAAGGKVTLIYSKDTCTLAQRLEEWLKESPGGVEVELAEPVEETDADSVYRCVQEVLTNNGGRAEQLKKVCAGLHYTGGTKVMSVHAYRALENWANERSGQKREAIFSYLDAQTLCMRIKRANRDTVSPSIGLKVKLSIKDLVKIHGWKWQRTSDRTPLMPITEPILPEIAAALLAIHQNSEHAEKWKHWLSHELAPVARTRSIAPFPVWIKDSEQSEKTTVLRTTRNWKKRVPDLTLPWPDKLPQLCETMKKVLGQEKAERLKLAAGTQHGHFKEVKDFCQWLDGGWLESTVLSALCDCSAALQLRDCGMNLHLTPIGDKDSEAEMCFEFDVVAMRGYQLFAFSCTTESDDGGLLKQKLFEAYIRARQMGGDEACVALVCTADPQKVRKLEREMSHDIGRLVRLGVFGREKLANLSQNIEQWVRIQSKEN